MPKSETSGRYLSFGGEEAWSEVHMWRKNPDADWHDNILTVLDKTLLKIEIEPNDHRQNVDLGLKFPLEASKP